MLKEKVLIIKAQQTIQHPKDKKIYLNRDAPYKNDALK